ncbi:MAG: hypothetical protein FWD26_11345 [Treponema sp.]|nr:hypothetical protein [Treponema sp.]
MKKTCFAKTAVFTVVFFLLPAMLLALDFDLAFHIYGGLGNPTIEENKFDYKIDITPRLFSLIGNKGELIVTAGLVIDPDTKYYFLPELLHTEFSMRFGNSGLKLGRFYYSDPLSFIFEGLFDGAQFFNVSSKGIFTVGAWYTGFIYKNNTVIDMTKDEQINNYIPFDYDDFFNTYFASRRIAASVGWEHPSLFEFMQLNTALIAQFDLNGNDEQYHSQYLIFKAKIPVNNFTFEFGGSVESVQRKIDGDLKPLEFAFAGEAGFMLMFPGNFNSRLSFNAKIAGGRIDGFCGAFVPVTSKYYGNILKHKMSGLSLLSLDYSIRLHRVLGISLNTSYFVRNDLGTFEGYPLVTGSDSKGYFLGAEFSGRLIWSPVSDMQFNLGGGMFIPAMGNAQPEQKIKWRVDLTAIFAL